jgi:hypothetical protein
MILCLPPVGGLMQVKLWSCVALGAHGQRQIDQ